MHDRDGGLKVLVLQILEKRAQLSDQEHALVDDGSGGQRKNIGCLRALLEQPPDDIEAAVKIQPLRDVLRLLDECLPDIRHAGKRLVPQNLRTDVDLSPPQEPQAFFLCNGLEHLLRTVFRKLILREEKHADTVFSLAADVDPES